MMRPVPNFPALLLDDALVIADLHLGIEEEARKKGVILPDLAKTMAEKALLIAKKARIKKIIVLGDLKHEIGARSRELRAVYKFIARLHANNIEVCLLPGNHDGGLQRHMSGLIKFLPVNGVLYNKVGLLHGHTWPRPELMNAETLVLGHNHPSVLLADKLGATTQLPCWVVAPLCAKTVERFQYRYRSANRKIKVVLLPAFNTLLPGNAVNRSGAYLGPLLASGLVDMKKGKVYLLDGTYLGRIEHLLVSQQ